MSCLTSSAVRPPHLINTPTLIPCYMFSRFFCSKRPISFSFSSSPHSSTGQRVTISFTSTKPALSNMLLNLHEALPSMPAFRTESRDEMAKAQERRTLRWWRRSIAVESYLTSCISIHPPFCKYSKQLSKHAFQSCIPRHIIREWMESNSFPETSPQGFSASATKKLQFGGTAEG